MGTDDMVTERIVHNILKKKIRQYGNREFFRHEDQVFGYEDFDRESDKVAAGLQSLGIAKGDKVAIVMKNRPEYLFLWFGLSKLGAIEVPINTAHRGDLLTYMIDKADCSLAMVESTYLDRVAPVLRNLPKLEMVLVLTDEAGRTQPHLDKPTMDYRKVIDNSGKYDEAEVLWHDPFIIMFTSGTTGPSKGSLMPHNYALHMAEILCNALEYTEKDRLYNALPLFHGNAQLLSTMPALMSGAKMVLAERFSASRFWGDIRNYECTAFNYIGGILPILLKADPTPDDSDNPLIKMMGAGAPMNLFDTVEDRFGVTLIEGYGMSEIGLPLMNTLKERKPGTCGKPWPDYDVKLVDDNGNSLPPDTPGEILVRPNPPYSMLLEYYNMPEKTVEAWRDLWFRTGDYLTYDEDGYFHFVDRKKDALRRRGENISSYEVEKVINLHPKVLESAAVAVNSEIGEDEVMVCLTLKTDKELAPEQLIAFCEEHMAYFMIPRYLRFMEKMPKTPTQRIQKYLLRKEGVTQDTWDREEAGYVLKR